MPRSESHPPALACRPALVLVGVLFALSGVAALVYQVAWQRILALHSGVGIYSVAMIVAAFLAGLGLGSHLGGIGSARLPPARALRMFAFLELGIALFAALSAPLYYDLLYLRAQWLYASPWSAGSLHFVSLLLPTSLMGMSLPFLVRAAVGDARTASRTIGYLYGINVVGASLGALVTPWILIRFLGIRGAILAGALCNLAAGLGALAMGKGCPEGETGPESPSPEPLPSETRSFPFWLVLYSLSGFCALSLEILWFRIVDVGVKSNAFTFGTVLSIYLLGLALGSLAGGPLAVRMRRPLRAFLLCQCLLLLYAGLAVAVLPMLPADRGLAGWFFSYWQGTEGYNLGSELEWATVLRLYLLLPAVLYAVPTMLMGLSFPALQRAVQTDPRTSGYKVGLLQAGNIAGCVAGSLLVGVASLSWLGTTGTLRVLLAGGVAFALLGGLNSGWRLFGPLAALLGLLIVALPGQDRLWLRLHGQSGGPALLEEDATGVMALTPAPDGGWRVSSNGKSESWIPYGGIHTWLGAVPAVVHPAPLEMAVIGLGSGDTAWASACRSETRRVTVFELRARQRLLLQRLAARERFPEVARLLTDRRIEVVAADGRNALERSDRKYDVIEVDALRPQSAYSGNLYSQEFYRSCARKLRPGGLMCVWNPVRGATFRSVFPYVLSVERGQILIGSNEPLTEGVAEWTARAGRVDVVAYLGRTAAAQIAERLSASEALPSRSWPAAYLNHDLFPADEFRSPR